MGVYVEDPDNDGEYLYVPYDDIKAVKKYPDQSMSFKLIGGKYHGMTVRLYAPYDEVRFPDGETYEIHPPIKKSRSNKWVLVHNPMLCHGIPVAPEGDEPSAATTGGTND